MRRVVASVVAVGVAALGIGLAAPSGAGVNNNGGPGGYNNCTGDNQANNYHGETRADSWHACN
jgi:hypothetical protein